MKGKRCRKCKRVKPLSKFHNSNKTRDGKVYNCIPCVKKTFKIYYWNNKERLIENSKAWRNANIELAKEKDRVYKIRRWNSLSPKEREHEIRRIRLGRYGMALDDYQKMFDSQGGVCAICKQPERRLSNKGKKSTELSIDHCHKTGAIRGLLCSFCNNMLGNSKDNILILQRAIGYLENSTRRGNE